MEKGIVEWQEPNISTKYLELKFLFANHDSKSFTKVSYSCIDYDMNILQNDKPEPVYLTSY